MFPSNYIKQIKNDMFTGDGTQIYYSTLLPCKSCVNQIMHHAGNCTRKPGRRCAILSSSELSGSLHKKRKLMNHTAPITYLWQQNDVLVLNQL